jgi:glucuronosyltransferase
VLDLSGALCRTSAPHASCRTLERCAQTFKQRLGNFLLHQAMLLVVGPMGQRLDAEMRRELGMPPPRPASEARKDVLLYLSNADPALEFPRPLPPLVQLVGPLLAKPPQALPPALQALMGGAGPRGAVFVSFGSVFTLTDAVEAATLASALASLNRTVLWRITDAELPVGVTLASLRLPPSVHALRWAPQNDILGSPSLAVFVTHGGTNSVYEAAYHGVPVVNLPFIADHADHSAKAEARGFGITVARASLTAGDPGPLLAAVDRAATDPALRRNAAKVGRMLRAHGKPAAERAADWVEYALEMPRDGSLSLASAAADVPWAVRASLDVYAALASMLALAMLVVVGMGRAAVGCMRRARRQQQGKQKTG